MLPIVFPVAAWLTVKEMKKQKTLDPVLLKGRFSENVTIRSVDKNGEFQPMWRKNSLGMFLSFFGIKREHHWLGESKMEFQLSNLLTNVGFAFFASRIGGAGAEAIANYLAVGTGTTAAAVTDTTLETESAATGLTRAAAAITRVTTTETNDTARAQLTFTNISGGTVAVTETGLLNAASGGVLVGRKVFSAVSVENNDGIQITYDVKCSA